MASLRRFLLRLVGAIWRERSEMDLAREVASHLALVEEDLQRRGLAPPEARRAARRAFNGVELTKELHRDARSFVWLDDLRRDTGYALRSVRKNPGVTVLGIVVMGLGIGANTAVFSVVNAVLLQPLPYPDPDRIVALAFTSRSEMRDPLSRQVSVPDFEDLQTGATDFESLARYSTRQRGVMVGGVAEYAVVTRVSPDFFRVFATESVVGRLFTDSEQQLGAAGAVLLSEGYARRHFSEARLAVGRSVRLLDRTLEVVGVLPSRFNFPEQTEIWVPDDAFPNVGRSYRSSNNYRVVGRVKRGVSLAQVEAAVGAIALRLERQYPQTNQGRGLTVKRLHDQMVGDVTLMMYLLSAAAALVLLIAGVNMATVLLARAMARRQEVAVRVALGASRGRVVRQMLVEGLVQSSIAGAAGLALASVGVRVLVALAPADLPRLAEVGVDRVVLAFALVLSLLSGLALALVPARHVSRFDVERELKVGSTRAATAARSRHLREGLVTLQLAMAVMLLAPGGLLLRSLAELQRVPLGFRPDHVLVVDATVATSDPRQGATRFFSSLLTEVRRLPGVITAGATMVPPSRVDATALYSIDQPLPDLNADTASGERHNAVMSIVAPNTFDALGMRLMRGRDFDDRDDQGAPLVAIVNETLARASLLGAGIVGHTIFCGFDSFAPMTVVGVISDVRQAGPATPPEPECYMPYLQHNYNGSTLSIVVRTAIEPMSLAETIRRKAHEVSPTVPVRFSTLESLVARNVAAPRFRALLVGLFAAIGLLLAVVGVFGVMAYVVSQRTGEIGLRMALGANQRQLLALLYRRGLILTALGLTLGLCGAAVATRFMASFLFGITPTDPLTFVAAISLLAVSSLLALHVPAWRATRIDPLVAIRSE